MNRKQFLYTSVLGLPLLVVSAACKHEIPQPAPEPRIILMEIDLSVSLMQPGDIIQDLVRGIFVKRIAHGKEAGAFICYNLACTHSGCIIALQSNGEFHCPCHGSKFFATGEVLAGPAARALDRFKMEVIANKLIIFM